MPPKRLVDVVRKPRSIHKLPKLLVGVLSEYIGIVSCWPITTRGKAVERTISVVISFPVLSILTHSLSSIANLFRCSSGEVLYSMPSKLPNLANIANSRASR